MSTEQLKKKYINVKIFDLIEKKSCIIKEIIDYPGDKTTVIRHTYGFGSSEEMVANIVLTADVEEYLAKRFSLPTQTNNNIKQLSVKKEVQVGNSDVTPAKVREFLYDVMVDVKSGKLPVDSARAISSTAQVVVNAWKVEQNK